MPPTTCKAVPAAPTVDASDNDWSTYKRLRDDAGDDCRSKLGAVHTVVEGWPK